jgi:hypothetical protein
MATICRNPFRSIKEYPGTVSSLPLRKRLKDLGITTGYEDGTYGPYDLVTRAQMAAFLARAFLGMP